MLKFQNQKYSPLYTCLSCCYLCDEKRICCAPYSAACGFTHNNRNKSIAYLILFVRWEPEIYLSKINWMLHKVQEPRAITIHQNCSKIIKAVSVMIAQSMNQKWNMCVLMLIPKSILSIDFTRIGFASFTVKRSFPEWWKLLRTMGPLHVAAFQWQSILNT